MLYTLQKLRKVICRFVNVVDVFDFLKKISELIILFKSLRKMEAEILAMCLHLYNAPPKACGLLTAGN